MRPLALLAGIALVAALATIGRSQPESPAARGFDHLVHEGKVAVAGSAAIPCADCHVDGRGRIDSSPGHGACFGACHGATPAPQRGSKPRPLGDDRRRLCTACHAPAAVTALEEGTAADLKAALAVDADYGLDFSHQAHATAAACQDCHANLDGAASRAPTHSRCAGCHQASASPAMATCDGCHRAAYGPATAPHLARGAYPVDAAFTHRAHAPRTGEQGCLDCHASVIETAGAALPAPTMDACALCHDGEDAFSTVAAACTRCHEAPRILLRRRDAPTRVARFSHTEHAGLGLDLTCAGCHQLDPTGRPLPPAANHAPCSDAGCHADDFASLTPTICSGCHVGDEPWRALHYDRPPAYSTELGARFSHRGHLAGTSPPVAADCADCHDTRSGARDRRLGRDHDDCVGAGCHDQDAEPALPDCSGCHDLGLIARRVLSRTSAPWSVRARFDHGRHRTDPRTDAPLPCADCHLDARDSTEVATMPTPPKATCAGCHDGGAAFKLTGHGCARCHGR